jgi:hypothetical protein
MKEKRLIKLEKKVRKRLGQRLLTYPEKKECLNNFINCNCNSKKCNCINFIKCKNCKLEEINFICDCECENCDFNKNDHIELLKQTDHLRLNFHATDESEIESNKNIIETFNDLFKDYRVIIQSRKGTLVALITTKYNYIQYYEEYWDDIYDIVNESTELPYIRLINYNGEGTINIIVDIIENIHNFEKIFYICFKCNKVENKSILETNINNKICKMCDVTEYHRIYLNVPFHEKDEIKILGGKFDGVYKKWYVERELISNYILSRWKKIIIRT